MPEMEELSVIDVGRRPMTLRLYQCPNCKKVEILEGTYDIPECDCDEETFNRGKEHVKKEVSDKIRELYDDEKPDLASLLVYIEHL